MTGFVDYYYCFTQGMYMLAFKEQSLVLKLYSPYWKNGQVNKKQYF